MITRKDIKASLDGEILTVTVQCDDHSYTITATNETSYTTALEMLADQIMRGEVGITAHDLIMVASDVIS